MKKQLMMEECRPNVVCDIPGCGNRRQYRLYKSKGNAIFLCGECAAGIANAMTDTEPEKPAAATRPAKRKAAQAADGGA